MSNSSVSSHAYENESSDSSSEFSGSEYDSVTVKQYETNEHVYQTPQKRKYRRSLHHGLSSKRANYHRVSPDQSARLHSSDKRRDKYVNAVDCVSSPAYEDDSSSSSRSKSSISLTSADFSSTNSDHAFDSDESNISSSKSNTSLSSNCTDSETDSDTDSFPEHSYDFIEEEKTKQEPLYEGCKLSEHTAYTMIMLFVQKHSLSKEAFSDLLLLISEHLPPSAKFEKSTYKVKEILKSTIGFQEPILHYYCDICQRYSQDRNICENDTCRRNNNRMLEFYDLRLEDQLKDMFEDDVFYNTIKREIQLKRSRNGNILYDITDGTVYRENLKRLQKHGDLYLTFTMNTDGVSLFSSSKKDHCGQFILPLMSFL